MKSTISLYVPWLLSTVAAALACAQSMPPLACNLKALTTEERARSRALTEAGGAAFIAARELPDGYRFRFDPAKLSPTQLGEWIGYEYRCCPFFRFQMEVNSTEGISLALSGGPGVKAFIAAEFARWMPGASSRGN